MCRTTVGAPPVPPASGAVPSGPPDARLSTRDTIVYGSPMWASCALSLPVWGGDELSGSVCEVEWTSLRDPAKVPIPLMVKKLLRVVNTLDRSVMYWPRPGMLPTSVRLEKGLIIRAVTTALIRSGLAKSWGLKAARTSGGAVFALTCISGTTVTNGSRR
jgi:hypothetical protein